MKKTVFLAILLSIFTISCGDEDKGGENLKTSLVYSEKAKIIDNNLIDLLISYNSETGEIVFKKGEITNSIGVGDILIGGVYEKLPAGLLKKVKAIDNSGENIVIETEYVHLNEAVIDGNISEKFELKSENIVEMERFHQNGKKYISKSIDVANYDTQYVHNFNYTLEGEGDNQLDITGTAGIAPSISIDLDFGWSIIEKLSLKLDLKATAALSILGKYENSYEIDPILIATYKFAPIQIPETPIVLCPEIALYLCLDGEVNGEISFSVSERAETSVTAQFETSLVEETVNELFDNEGSWDPVKVETENIFEWSDPTFNFSGNLRSYLKVNSSISLFEYESDAVLNTASISLSANLFLRGVIDLDDNPWWVIDGGVFGGFKASGKLLPDYEAEFLEISETIAQADGEYDPEQNIVKGVSNLYYVVDEAMEFVKPLQIIKIFPQNDGTSLAIVQMSFASGYYLVKFNKNGEIIDKKEGFIFCEDDGDVDCSPFHTITNAIETEDSIITVGYIPTIAKVRKSDLKTVWAKSIDEMVDQNDHSGLLDEFAMAYQIIKTGDNSYVALLTRSLIHFSDSGMGTTVNRLFYYSSDELLEPDPEYWKRARINSIYYDPIKDKGVMVVAYSDVPWELYKNGSADIIEFSMDGSIGIENRDIFNDHDYSDDRTDFVAEAQLLTMDGSDRIIAGKYFENMLGYTHFITKLDSDGEVKWRTPFCLSLEQTPMTCSIPLDSTGYEMENILTLSNGSVVITGKLQEEKQRGDGELAYDNSSFIIKFDKNGNFSWGKLFNTEDGEFLYDNKIKTIGERGDKKGIILAGSHKFEGSERAWYLFLTETGECSFKSDSGIEVKNIGGIFDLSLSKKITKSVKKSKLDGDADGDMVCDGDSDIEGVCVAGPDNCPNISNRLQLDADGDGFGDKCDCDSDNDQVCDSNKPETDCLDNSACEGVDNCIYIENQNQNDEDQDGIGDLCDLHDEETRKFGNYGIEVSYFEHDSSAEDSYDDYTNLEFETVKISE